MKYYLCKKTPNVDNQSVSIKVLSTADEPCLVVIDKKVYKIDTNKTHEIKIDNDHIWAFSRNGIDWKLVKGRLPYKDIEDRPIDVAKLIGKLADEGGE